MARGPSDLPELEAKAGSRPALGGWLGQRATAAVMILAVAVFALYAALTPGSGYYAWKALFEPLPVRIGLTLAFFSLLLHAWLGVREVLMDYLPWLVWRVLLYGLIGLGLAAQALWFLYILWGG